MNFILSSLFTFNVKRAPGWIQNLPQTVPNSAQADKVKGKSAPRWIQNSTQTVPNSAQADKVRVKSVPGWIQFDPTIWRPVLPAGSWHVQSNLYMLIKSYLTLPYLYRNHKYAYSIFVVFLRGFQSYLSVFTANCLNIVQSYLSVFTANCSNPVQRVWVLFGKNWGGGGGAKMGTRTGPQKPLGKG